MSTWLTIIIPTKDRAEILAELFESLRQLDGLAQLQPEIIVADNDSRDQTPVLLESVAANFPAPMRTLKVSTPGKSAAINEALRLARGEFVALLDDDVVVDRGWLRAIEAFFRTGDFQAGQGKIGLRSPEADDPEIQKLISRYRTIPHLDHGPEVKEVHSLNGANVFISRGLLNQLGGFDERLGPGASGTSEDVDVARRLAQAGICIGYVSDCIVYHRIDRHRLSDEHFQHIHRRQGLSRLLIKDRSYFQILSSLGRAHLQYVFYSFAGDERRRYRSMGRIFHYREMAHAKRNRAAQGSTARRL